MEWGWLVDYILQCCCNNIIVSTGCTCTCDGVFINMQGIGSEATSMMRAITVISSFYAMHATSTRAITVI